MSRLSRRAFSTTALAAGLAGCTGANVPSKPKNVLFLAVDDLRPALNCYGAIHVHSPHIDWLAARGVRFDRAYCQQAVCAPSRISLLTGLRPDSTTIYDLDHPMVDVIPDTISLPHHFKNNGYETVSIGKIYHHGRDDPEAWSAKPWKARGEWRGRGYMGEESARIAVDQEEEALAAWEKAKAAGGNPNKPRIGMGPAFEAPDVPDNAYADGMNADQAIAEMQRLNDQPFFLAVGFHKPHLPFNAPKKYWDLYDPNSFQLPVQTDWPEGAPEIARTNWGELRGYHGMPSKGPMPEDLVRTLTHAYYACVSFMDAQVGRILDELDARGLSENTAIVLWGDHGWKLNDYGAWCKHTNFEIDTRVPLIVADPDHQSTAGQGTPALSEFVDVYPTLSELCGLPIPAHCEGSSMAPLLRDPARRWKQGAYSQYPRGAERMGYSVRSEGHRYTEWIDRETGEVMDRELYSHADGSVAARNLAPDAAHADTVAALSQLLDKRQGWKAVRQSL
jgi:iduronate 2-sulfatase